MHRISFPSSSPLNRTISTEAPSFPVSGDLEGIVDSSFGGERLKFPGNLDEIDHWASFRIYKQEFRRSSDFPKNSTPMANIFLPMPLNLGTEYNQSYNSEGIGLAGSAGAALGSSVDVSSVEKTISSIKDKIGSIRGKDIGEAGIYYGLQAAESELGAVVGAALGGGVVGAGIGAAAGQALKGAVAGAGLARNPYMAVMYNNPEFRSHSFSWKFIPRNFQESKTLQAIINKFKYHSAPEINQNVKHFFNYPEQFDIDFHYPEYLFNIGPSVLTNLSVNYHAEGQPLYFNVDEGFEPFDFSFAGGPAIQSTAKAPVSIEISATFQEIFVITKDRILKDNR